MSGQNEFDPDAQHQFSPGERAERDQLRQRITQYFCERIEVDPAVLEVGSIASLWGKWQEGLRTQTLCEASYKHQLFDIDLPSISLSAKIIKAGHFYPGGAHTAIFALYDDGTMLWLDDHTSNREFDIFWQRENIHRQNAYEAAAFMMATKFNYLPEPGRYAILNSVEDIPQARERSMLIEHNLQQELQEYEQKLADVAPLICPPDLITDASGIQVQFCVYVQVVGRVWSINCHFDLNGGLTYTGKILGEWLGEAFMPR